MLRSDDLEEIFRQAGEVAEATEQDLNTAHLLLAVYTVESHAKILLEDLRFDEDTIIGKVLELRKSINDFLTEPRDVLKNVKDKIDAVAKGCKNTRANSLHLIVAIVGVKDSLAYAILNRTRGPIGELRTVALSYLTNGLPRRYARANVYTAPTELLGPPSQKASAVAAKPGRRPVNPKSAGTADTALPIGGRTVENIKDGSSELPTRDRKHSKLTGMAAKNNRPVLHPGRFPILNELGYDLTEAAEEGELDPLIGRSREVEEICDVLGKRRANNPILLGPPGVGKTALVEGLAWKQVNATEEVAVMADKRLVAIDLSSLLSPSSNRGGLVDRLKSLREEVKAAEDRVILFLDEIHQMSSLARMGGDPASEIKASLARGEFPCIGATTDEEYKELVESDPALKRRFHPIFVSEPSISESLDILIGIIPSYENHHSIEFEREALEAAVKLSARYVPDRVLPDKAIHIVDLAASRARRYGKTKVTVSEVAEVVGGLAGVPPELLSGDEKQRMLKAEEILERRIVGHKRVLSKVAGVLRRNYAGFNSNRPIGSFLFLGPTGVGKTETAKVLAEFLFKTRDALCRFDMSEYGEAHTVARLIGAPPGYVGYGEGGQLTEAIRRRPYSVVLLDEIEKAHQDVLLILLQALDDGRLTDGRGRTVDFSNTVIIMTSNLGAANYSQKDHSIGFSAEAPSGHRLEQVEEKVVKAARSHFPIELWNRIDEKCVFSPLSRNEVKEIARLLVEQSSGKLKQEKGVSFMPTEAVIDWLIQEGGFDPELGARPMRRMVQQELESRVAEMILAGRVGEKQVVAIDVSNNALTLTVQQNSKET
ncbi:MAG: ATP-dependent Clp protease ATP-binding subunit [Deltaproteobacteria bacterium]|nr:ATP-dependent Clp protease ATP-binding subunit [Deltaproteobacteria bacterium]